MMLYQLSYQALWEQGGPKEGMQVLVLGAHYIKICFYYGTPLGDDAVTSGTRLDALAIGPNSSKIINIVALVCKSQDIFSGK